ncbi:MAG: DNA repair protein RadC [Anaerolineae bacterium]|nr:DNA repair protein RadC [Anaerolineae bacterium]
MIDQVTELSNPELLALVLCSDVAQQKKSIQIAEQILKHFRGLHGLARLEPYQLQQFQSIDTTQKLRLCALIELAKRLSVDKPPDYPVINRAADAAQLVMDMQYLQQEHIRVLLLDTNRRVTNIQTIYVGTLNASLLRTAEVFKAAVVNNNPAIILVHNHPSGDVAPSPEDIEITRTLIAAGQLLDIIVLDHLIIGDHDWISIKESGLAFRD